MLTVQLSLSIWWLMLALIPLAVIILALSAILPHTGKLHDLYEATVESILFYPVPGAPQLTFIKAALALLSITSLLVGVSVYNDGQREALPASMPLDKQILVQAKTFRNQRNLYLSCLALALWWMVFTVYTYKSKIAKLLAQVEELQNGGRASSSSSSSAAAKAAVNKIVQEHETAEPVAETNQLKKRK